MLDIAIAIGGIGLTVAAVLCLIHIMRAPTLADRLVGTDLLLTTIVSGFVLSAIATGTATLLALAVVTSLLGYVGTTAVARFIETRGL
jgi:multicomponent Na+:H+ antiporter subunit F